MHDKLLDRLIALDKGALQALNELHADPAEVKRLAWEVLQKVDGRRSNSYCVELFKTACRAAGDRKIIEKELLEGWDNLPVPVRMNMGLVTHDKDAMSTSTAVALFDRAANTYEQHLIMTGLVSTFNDRGLAPETLLDRLSKVGKYEDPKTQEQFEDFCSRARHYLEKMRDWGKG